MIEPFLGALVGATIFGATCWTLGWYYGVKTLRNRHKKLIKLIKENNEHTKERNKITGNNWYDGYFTGVSSTLTAFEMFLEKFKE